MITVGDMATYREAVAKSHLEGSLAESCLKAELVDTKGDLVFFRNYEDTELEYIIFCFTRMTDYSVRLNYVSYVEWDEDMDDSC